MIVHSMDRFARSLKDLVTEVDKLVKRGIAIQFVKENITFTAKKLEADPIFRDEFRNKVSIGLKKKIERDGDGLQSSH